MSVEGQKFYPGDGASPAQVLELAAEYHRAANAVLSEGRRGNPLSRFPYRLLAIQAIELYLNSMLLERGFGAEKVRGMQHDLAWRAHLAGLQGLVLKDRTVRHLQSLSNTREYLVARYGPNSGVPLSELNRLGATLSEVACKVSAIVDL
jgi:hypothetical protein